MVGAITLDDVKAFIDWAGGQPHLKRVAFGGVELEFRSIEEGPPTFDLPEGARDESAPHEAGEEEALAFYSST